MCVEKYQTKKMYKIKDTHLFMFLSFNIYNAEVYLNKTEINNGGYQGANFNPRIALIGVHLTSS